MNYFDKPIQLGRFRKKNLFLIEAFTGFLFMKVFNRRFPKDTMSRVRKVFVENSLLIIFISKKNW